MDEQHTAPTHTEEPSVPDVAGGEPAPLTRDGATRADRGLVGLVAFVATAGIIAAAIWLRDVPVTTSHYLLLSMLLFTVGALGVLMRRNALVLFMCIELMLNAVNLAFVAFAQMHGRMEGQVVVLFVMIVAAAEVAVGLAIIVTIFRKRGTASVDDLNLLRG